LAAKALVIGGATFTTQLVAAIVAVQLGKRIMLSNGGVLPVSLLTELRIMVGTAAAVAVAAVLALALGALFRRHVVAVIVGIVLTGVPFILAFANLVPEAVSQWLLRLTPAAGFAIQQSVQVTGASTLQAGYYPLAPWAGFAVLCGYTVLALGLAVFLPPRRDA
jgi:ABC-type transport system involved in multi-copper enzyme maturation permease subunit